MFLDNIYEVERERVALARVVLSLEYEEMLMAV